MTHAELQQKMAQWEQEQEEARIAELERQIAELQKTKEIYIAAKIAVVNVDNDCNSENSNWSSLISSFENEIENINKTGLFEGEISECLKNSASDVKDSLDSGVASADNLSTALGGQMRKIDARIKEIDLQINGLKSQI